jgi:hypothetical protein
MESQVEISINKILIIGHTERSSVLCKLSHDRNRIVK